MDTKQKAQLIGAIISNLRFHAKEYKKPFDTGTVFFSLIFKNESELRAICKAMGI